VSSNISSVRRPLCSAGFCLKLQCLELKSNQTSIIHRQYLRSTYILLSYNIIIRNIYCVFANAYWNNIRRFAKTFYYYQHSRCTCQLHVTQQTQTLPTQTVNIIWDEDRQWCIIYIINNGRSLVVRCRSALKTRTAVGFSEPVRCVSTIYTYIYIYINIISYSIMNTLVTYAKLANA